MKRLVPLALVVPALAACEAQSMNRQAKVTPQAPAPTLPGGVEQMAPPPGTVAVDQPARTAAETAPPPVTLALVERGRERHAIFCAPCHGREGRGDGTVVQRGYPAPQPYDDPRLVAAPAAELYGAIANGYGIMFPQAERVEPADRWAIVAYIRALQLSDRRARP